MNTNPRRETAIRIATLCSLSAVTVLAFGGAALAAVPAPGVTALVTLESTGFSGVNESAQVLDISANGRFVLFSSAASDVGPTANASGNNQLYRRDLVNNTVALVSARIDKLAADDGDSPQGSISADGRYVAFSSRASDLVLGVTVADKYQVYKRDMDTATTTLLSRTLNAGNGDSIAPSISDDGSKVAFASVASDLIGATRNAQVILASSGTLSLVSASNATSTVQADRDAYVPSLSGDGTKVTFQTDAANLTIYGSNNRSQIYERDLASNATDLVSFASTGKTAADRPSVNASVNYDGSKIAFQSQALNLTKDPRPGGADEQVFLRDVPAATTELVSISLTGTWSDSDANFPSISSDGDRVAFTSASTDLLAGVTQTPDDDQIWVRDRSDSQVALVSSALANPRAGGGPAGAYALYPHISQNGVFVGFTSVQTDLTATDSQGIFQGYVRALPDIFVGPTPTPTPTPTGTGTSTGGSTGGPDAGTGDPGGIGGGHGGTGSLASTGTQGPTIGFIALGAVAAVGGSALALAWRRRKA